MLQAQTYSVKMTRVDGIDVVRLADQDHGIVVSIVPSIGNIAYEMKIHGQPVLWSPYSSLAEFKAKPVFLGIPFLSPWANRLDQDAFWANGRKYVLNPDLNNFRRDQHHNPIHGLVAYADGWKVVSTGSSQDAAWVTSRLEFWRQPAWMAQFPFAHNIEMTYRLARGTLEVRTAFENISGDGMPLAIGFHPYFTIPGVPRDQWRVHLSARDHVVLSGKLIPTGELEPTSQADSLPLAGIQLDDVFTGLVRDENGLAQFSVEGGGRRISVTYGTNYKVAVVYAPAGKGFICFEPMTGITNAFNLAHEGKYRELQTVPPQGKWEESFWITATGW